MREQWTRKKMRRFIEAMDRLRRALESMAAASTLPRDE
jgi:hypothetical protein